MTTRGEGVTFKQSQLTNIPISEQNKQKRKNKAKCRFLKVRVCIFTQTLYKGQTLIRPDPASHNVNVLNKCF